MKAIAQAAQPATFSFSDTQHIRVEAGPDGGPLFCAKDVCAVLGYANDTDAVRKHCREAGVAKRYLRSGGQRRALAFIDEGNLYRLILKSRLPAAQRFEAWVCDEVLPAIRQHGVYAAVPPPASQAVVRTSPAQGAEPLTPNDLANLRRLVWRVANINLYEDAWTRTIWAGLRKSTGTRTRGELLVDHLGVIEQELRDVLAVADTVRALTDALNDTALRMVGAGARSPEVIAALRKVVTGAKVGPDPLKMGRMDEREFKRLADRGEAVMDHAAYQEP